MDPRIVASIYMVNVTCSTLCQTVGQLDCRTLLIHLLRLTTFISVTSRHTENTTQIKYCGFATRIRPRYKVNDNSQPYRPTVKRGL